MNTNVNSNSSGDLFDVFSDSNSSTVNSSFPIQPNNVNTNNMATGMNNQGVMGMMGSQPNMMGSQPMMASQQTNMMGSAPNTMGSAPNMMGSQLNPGMMGSPQPNMMGSPQPNMMGSQPMMGSPQPNMMGSQPNMMSAQPNMMMGGMQQPVSPLDNLFGLI